MQARSACAEEGLCEVFGCLVHLLGLLTAAWMHATCWMLLRPEKPGDSDEIMVRGGMCTSEAMSGLQAACTVVWNDDRPTFLMMTLPWDPTSQLVSFVPPPPPPLPSQLSGGARVAAHHALRSGWWNFHHQMQLLGAWAVCHQLQAAKTLLWSQANKNGFWFAHPGTHLQSQLPTRREFAVWVLCAHC